MGVDDVKTATLDIDVEFLCKAKESCAGSLQVRGDRTNSTSGLWISFHCTITSGCTYRVDGKENTVPFSASSPWKPSDGFQFRILVDTSVVEVYAFNGRSVFTQMYIPSSATDTAVRLRGGSEADAVSASIVVFKMGSAYEPLQEELLV